MTIRRRRHHHPGREIVVNYAAVGDERGALVGFKRSRDGRDLDAAVVVLSVVPILEDEDAVAGAVVERQDNHGPKQALEPSACSVESITCEPDDDKGDTQAFGRLGDVVLVHLTERGQNLKSGRA